MKKPRQADSDLFRQAIGEVAPIKTPDTVALDAPKPVRRRTPGAQQAEDDNRGITTRRAGGAATVANRQGAEGLCYKKPGVQDKQFNKLRRGKFAIENELDLHGLTAGQAEVAVDELLTRCSTGGTRCVLIIHGKGSTERPAVIRGRLPGWLHAHAAALAWCPAQPRDGGSGAAYVLLKRG